MYLLENPQQGVGRGWEYLRGTGGYSCLHRGIVAAPHLPPPPPPTPPRFPADAGRHQRGLLTLTRVGNRQTLEE